MNLRYGDLSEIREKLSPAEERFEARRRTAGLYLGPAVFLLLLLAPLPAPSAAASRLAAVVAWVLVWWITEAVPIPVTALLGPSLMVLLRVSGPGEAFSPFGDPVIFLFLGSFMLAEAMAVHGLDRRVAFALLSSRLVGGSAARVLLAFAGLAAGLSMWLSNSATTAMLFPIALGVLGAMARLLSAGGREVDPTRLRFGTALMLLCAFASSIGGIGTPVGTPPNLIAMGYLDKLAGVKVPFFQWMLLALPILLVMLSAALVLMRLLLPPEVRSIEGASEILRRERAAMGPMSRGEWNVLSAFLLAVVLWVLPGAVAAVAGTSSGLYVLLQSVLPESVVALAASSLLFLLPADRASGTFTLTWNQAVRIDWGTLLLFGGGLSLGAAMFKTGLAGAVGQGLVSATGARSTLALTFLFAAVGIVVTEVTSNTAAATMLVPLAIAAAASAGVSPLEPAVACALGCSMAFMLPVSTPPNAIVYGSGCVRITQMIKVGVSLDAVAVVVIPLGVYIVAPLVLGGGGP
ncbi:MAG: SLC13 family permease [Acidobacteriota bacterium]